MNAIGKDFNSALIQAVSNSCGHKCIKMLIETGADVNWKGSNGNALHGAVLNSDHKSLDLLLTAGADVNATGNDGNAPLIHVV